MAAPQLNSSIGASELLGTSLPPLLPPSAPAPAPGPAPPHLFRIRALQQLLPRLVALRPGPVPALWVQTVLAEHLRHSR